MTNAQNNCPLCLGGACMWSVMRDGVTTCEPPARLRARVTALQAMPSDKPDITLPSIAPQEIPSHGEVK